MCRHWNFSSLIREGETPQTLGWGKAQGIYEAPARRVNSNVLAHCFFYLSAYGYENWARNPTCSPLWRYEADGPDTKVRRLSLYFTCRGCSTNRGWGGELSNHDTQFAALAPVRLTPVLVKRAKLRRLHRRIEGVRSIRVTETHGDTSQPLGVQLALYFSLASMVP